MPDHTFELAADDDPFADDPLTLSLPDAAGKMRKFTCLPRANLPLVDPQDKPVTWFVDALVVQIVEDERDEFRAALTDAIESNRIMLDKLAEIFVWLRETREAAEQGTLARKIKRPTSRGSRSQPS